MKKVVYEDKDANSIRLSQVAKIESDILFKGFGIKYVVSGEEVYTVNKKKYVVKEGNYIIGNDFSSALVQIDQKQDVHGLCIDISPKIISEVADFHDLNKNDLKEFLLSDQLFVNRYNAQNTCLGYSLKEINSRIKSGNFENNLQHNELFYSLAESIITDQRFVFDHLNKMDFKKTITNEEVFRSLLVAKTMMDDQLLENLSLEQISQQTGISKYHFIRLFKNTFGISPYQYQKLKRLDFARTALTDGKSIFEVALMIGYADVPTFSKAYKNVFGHPPGNVRKSNF